jgi:glycosyltransferase involved in cell wall biosynthesis
MHILIIPSWYPEFPGDIVGSFFREQAQALNNQGCKIGVITLQLRSLRDWRSVLTGRYDTTVEDDHGVETYRKNGMGWFPRMPRLMAWLWKKHTMLLFEGYINEHGMPDIIHVHSMLYAGWAAKIIADKYQIPYVVTEHSSAFARGLVTPAKKNITKQIAKAAHKRLTVSEPFADLLSEFFMTKNYPWEVMPNIVHKRFFATTIRSRNEVNPFTFINISLLTQNKGVDVLIKAFAKAIAIQPDMKLKIGGDGSEGAALAALSHELGVADSIEFMGMLSRDQVVEQMLASDVFVLSSLYETFGVVVIEALALGKPVIATRCGGPEDIVRKEDGILVQVNDVEALAAAMLTVYNNLGTYNGEEIQVACRARYSEQAITEKLMQVYNDVLGTSLQLIKKSM